MPKGSGRGSQFTAIGLVFFIWASLIALFTGERTVGIFGLLFFGGGAVAYFFLPRTGRGNGDVLQKRIVIGGSERSALVFPTWRREVWLTIVVMAGATTACLVMVLNASEFDTWPTAVVMVVGSAALLFFGSGVAGALIGLLRFRFRLALCSEGILLVRSIGAVFLRWEDLAEVGPIGSRADDRHELTVGLNLRTLAHLPWRHRPGAVLTRAFFGWHLSLTPVQLAASTLTAERVLRYYLEHPEKRELIGREPVPRQVLAADAGSDT